MIRRLLRWLLILGATLVVASGVAYLFRKPLLVAAANAWIVNEPAQRADAIVVLGGGMETRPAAAAKLYREGWAPRILVLQPEPGSVQERGLTPGEAETTRRMLESEKVPASAIELLKAKVTSTQEESLVVAEWVKQHHAKRVLVPTDAFHTRRARWILKRQLASTGATALMVAAPPRRYTISTWWQSEYGVLDFQNEVIKFAYYWWNY